MLYVSALFSYHPLPFIPHSSAITSRSTIEPRGGSIDSTPFRVVSLSHSFPWVSLRFAHGYSYSIPSGFWDMEPYPLLHPFRTRSDVDDSHFPTLLASIISTLTSASSG